MNQRIALNYSIQQVAHLYRFVVSIGGWEITGALFDSEEEAEQSFQSHLAFHYKLVEYCKILGVSL